MKLTIEDIETKLREFIAAEAAMPASRITNETTLADLGIDSLDAIELVIALEDEYGLSIDESEIEQLKTFQQAVEALAKKLGVPNS